MIIYKVTNKINKKIYIGQTVNSLDYRMKQHYRSSKRDSYYFHNALKKYRIGDFKWEIVCWCDNLDQLNLMEELLILVYNSANQNKGYNLKKGGKINEKNIGFNIVLDFNFFSFFFQINDKNVKLFANNIIEQFF